MILNGICNGLADRLTAARRCRGDFGQERKKGQNIISMESMWGEICRDRKVCGKICLGQAGQNGGCRDAEKSYCSRRAGQGVTEGAERSCSSRVSWARRDRGRREKLPQPVGWAAVTEDAGESCHSREGWAPATESAEKSCRSRWARQL